MKLEKNIFDFIKYKCLLSIICHDYICLNHVGFVEKDKPIVYLETDCPLCDGQASFHINENKEIFYCDKCYIGGDIISFIGFMEECSPVHAVRFLIKKYNIEVPEEYLKEIEMFPSFS